MFTTKIGAKMKRIESLLLAGLLCSSGVWANPRQTAAEAANLALLPGFKAELVYTVPNDTLGSWVAITTAPGGGLFVSDQFDAGLFHVMPAALGDARAETVVTPVPAGISSAQGLFWAFGGLYVHVNHKQKSGLYKLTDTDGNGDLDAVARLQKIEGGGEHGPHAIIYTEDQQALYINAGNATSLPGLSGSRAPANWTEGHILPRIWDAKGPSKSGPAPGGWVCKVAPDGKSWEVFASGFRNEYDIALNAQGELFSYDADSESDMGSPWYRPTRVCHVVSGAEFGWRNGAGKWPVYYEDSLPPVVDIGPGSPTGIVFGTQAKFPAKYQRALFILDWTYGTIYAIHLRPSGASYTAEKEEFLSGAPLPVTDAVIGADGALYFTTGGRKIQSSLYRVYYAGDASTAPSENQKPKAALQARAQRRRLEAFHGKKHPGAIRAAWPYLGHQDRFLRFAARIAIESQPLGAWRDKALNESDPQTAALALIALARQGGPPIQNDLLKAIGRFDLAGTGETAALGLLRAYVLSFERMGRPGPEAAEKIIAQVEPCLPAGNENLNAELLRILVYLDAPGVVEKGLALIAEARPPVLPDWADLVSRNDVYGGTVQKMLDAPPPTQKINYALMLGTVRYGWSMEQREAYFTFFNEAAKRNGGKGYNNYLANIRDGALTNCSEAERLALAPITGQDLEPLPEFEITAPKGADAPWTHESAMAAVERRGLQGRSFKNGRNGFHAVGCIACHSFDGAGGPIGPDLSSVASKFPIPDLLEAIIDPSKVISDQYASSIVTLKDGTVIQGIVDGNPEDKENGQLKIHTPTPYAEPVPVKMTDVKTIEESKTSQMPPGLANFLNEDELLDLLAYLISRGNPEAPVFK